MNKLPQLLPAALFALLAAVFFGYFIVRSPSAMPWAAAALLLVVFLTFHKPFYGLVVLVFSMLLSPEIALGRVGDRPVTVRIDDLMIVGVFLAWLAHQTLAREKKVFARTPLDVPLIAYIVILLTATALGVMRGYVVPARGVFYVLKYLEYLIIFFLAANIIVDTRQVRTLLWCGFVTACLVTLNAYGQLLRGIGRTYAPFDVPHGIAGFGEPATLGGYYLIVFAVLMGIFAFSSSTAARAFLFGSLLFMLPTFARTFSRASYFGMIPLYAAVVVFSRTARIWWVLAAVGLTIVSPYLFPRLKDAMEQRIVQTFTGAYAQQELRVGGKTIKMDLSAMARVWAWQYILKEKLTRHIFLGWGVTGTRFVDAQIPLILGETGLLGLLAFAWIIVIIFHRSFLVMKDSVVPLHRGLGLGLLAATAALLTQSLTTNTFIIVRIMEPFWFLTALIMRIPYLEKNTPEETAHAAA